MTLYNTRANSRKGDDFRELLRLVHLYLHWENGRDKNILIGQLLRSKMVLEI
jgi:hypothetical protein